MVTRSIFLFFLLFSTQTWAQRKALFIIVDGIPADVIEKLKPPTLFEIAGSQGYTRAYVGGAKGGYSQSPTISAVGYNHVLTGTWTNKHNVWDNDIKDQNYHYWNVFRIAREVRPDIRTAIFSTWLDNRTKLVGDGLAAAGGIKIDYAFDGYEHDTVRFPHDRGRKFISDIDDYVVTQAVNTIETQAPDLSWVYLEYTDDMGHEFGDSPQFYDAVKVTDERLGRIWRAVKARQQNYGEEWLVVITTDHGRTSSNGKGHGGQSERERTTWIVTNATNTNEHFRSLPGAVDVAPTVLRHLNIEIPDHVLMEMDGIPLIGKISVDNLRATRKKDIITLSWRALPGDRGTGEVFMATTNKFKSGKADQYTKVATVDLDTQNAYIPVPPLRDKKRRGKKHTGLTVEDGQDQELTYKFVLKAEYNWATTWWVKD